MVRAFGMNPKFAGSSPPQVDTFCVSKLWHFNKNIRLCVESKMDDVPRTQLTFQVSTYIKQISIPPEPVLKKHRTANLLPWQFKWPEHLTWIGKLEVRVSLKPRHVLSQKRCISTRTSLHVSKMNAIAIAQLIFQMLSFYFQNNIIMSLTYTLLISGIVPNRQPHDNARARS